MKNELPDLIRNVYTIIWNNKSIKKSSYEKINLIFKKKVEILYEFRKYFLACFLYIRYKI